MPPRPGVHRGGGGGGSSGWLRRLMVLASIGFACLYFFFFLASSRHALQAAALATPLYHGVELARGLSLGTATWLSSLGHVAYLAALCAAGTALAVRLLRGRLQA